MRGILFMSKFCGGCHTVAQMMERRPPPFPVEKHVVENEPYYAELFKRLGGLAFPGLAIDRTGAGQWQLVPANAVIPIVQGRVAP